MDQPHYAGAQGYPQQTSYQPTTPAFVSPAPRTDAVLNVHVCMPVCPPWANKPGPEFWGALLASQKAARKLAPDSKVENKAGKELYAYVSAEQIVEESRVLLEHGLLVTQSLQLGDRRTHAAFTVAHAATGQALCYPFEWPNQPTDKFDAIKTTAATTTFTLRWFLRGLLQIRTSEEGESEPRVPVAAQAASHTQHQQAFGGPPPQPHYAPPGYSPYTPPHQQSMPPVQGYTSPQGTFTGTYMQPPPPQNMPPAAANQLVQQFQQELGSQLMQAPQQGPPPSGPGFYMPPASPQQSQPEQARVTVEPDEPQDTDGWYKLLCNQKWAWEDAIDLASLNHHTPIYDDLRDKLSQWIDQYYGSRHTLENAERAIAAWKGTGFTPRPDLPDAQRPRPLGIHVLRYARKIKWPVQQVRSTAPAPGSAAPVGAGASTNRGGSS